MGSLISPVSEPRTARHDYAALIRAVMAKRGVSVTRLYEEGVIRKCTARAFDGRLASGEISAKEFSDLFAYLDINPLRATLALTCLENAEGYFDPTCKTIAELAVEAVVTLHEEIAACEGDFEPIRLSLCKALAQRVSGMIVDHHKRIEEARAAVF